MLTCDRDTPGPCPALFAGRPDWCSCRVNAAAAIKRGRQRRLAVIIRTWTVSILVAAPVAAVAVIAFRLGESLIP